MGLPPISVNLDLSTNSNAPILRRVQRSDTGCMDKGVSSCAFANAELAGTVGRKYIHASFWCSWKQLYILRTLLFVPQCQHVCIPD